MYQRFKSLSSPSVWSTYPNPLRFLLVILPFLLQSCLPATQFNGSKFCPAYLKEGDDILLGALTSPNYKFQVNSIRKELRGRKINVRYAPEEEWNLRAAGITNPLDTTSYRKLLANGITHILLIREVSANKGDVYAYKTPLEVSQELNPIYPYQADPGNPAHKAEFAVHLISLKTKEFYSFTVESQINGMQVREDNGGRTTVNAGSVEKARNVAIRKSAQRIARYCR